MTYTEGLSPKAVLALLFPLIAATLTALVAWGVTGEFNTTEIAVAATGTGAALVAALGAYIGRPGDVRPAFGPASDVMLADALGHREPPPEPEGPVAVPAPGE